MVLKDITRGTFRLLTCRKLSISSLKEQNLWTRDNIVKSPHRDIEIPRKTIPEHIWENMEKWPNKTAMICGISRRSYSYHQLYKYSRNFAAALRSKFNITDGDVVCMMMSNSPEYAMVILGIIEAGAIATPVNPIYTPYEVQRQLMLSDAKILVGTPETVPILKEALSLSKKDLQIICVKVSSDTTPTGTISFEELVSSDNINLEVLKKVNRTYEDVAVLPYSSGTTGLPKGVELTHKNIVVNLMQTDVDTVRHYDETTETSQSTALGLLPFFHSYGLCLILLHKLSVGYKIVTLPTFQPNTLINLLKEHPINLMHAVPPLMLFLGSHTGITKEHLEPIKTIISGAAPLPNTDIYKVLDKLKPGANFLHLYGLTEASPLATAMLPGSQNYSTVGYGLPNTELRIVNAEGRPLGADEIGELLIRGPNVMKGYRNNSNATKETITKDGWLKTGDLAKIDKDGAVTIADRIKELIKVKGYQVPPAELENVLKEHPDVLDAAVIGVPDTNGDEFPKAFLVLKDGHKTDANEIKTFVAKRVAKYKRVKEITFLDKLPKTPSGKILKRVLKDEYS